MVPHLPGALRLIPPDAGTQESLAFRRSFVHDYLMTATHRNIMTGEAATLEQDLGFYVIYTVESSRRERTMDADEFRANFVPVAR